MEVVTDVPLSLFTEHFHKGRTFVLSLQRCILPRTKNTVLDVTTRKLLIIYGIILKFIRLLRVVFSSQ